MTFVARDQKYLDRFKYIFQYKQTNLQWKSFGQQYTQGIRRSCNENGSQAFTQEKSLGSFFQTSAYQSRFSLVQKNLLLKSPFSSNRNSQTSIDQKPSSELTSLFVTNGRPSYFFSTKKRLVGNYIPNLKKPILFRHQKEGSVSPDILTAGSKDSNLFSYCLLHQVNKKIGLASVQSKGLGRLILDKTSVAIQKSFFCQINDQKFSSTEHSSKCKQIVFKSYFCQTFHWHQSLKKSFIATAHRKKIFFGKHRSLITNSKRVLLNKKRGRQSHELGLDQSLQILPQSDKKYFYEQRKTLKFLFTSSNLLSTNILNAFPLNWRNVHYDQNILERTNLLSKSIFSLPGSNLIFLYKTAIYLAQKNVIPKLLNNSKINSIPSKSTDTIQFHFKRNSQPHKTTPLNFDLKRFFEDIYYFSWVFQTYFFGQQSTKVAQKILLRDPIRLEKLPPLKYVYLVQPEWLDHQERIEIVTPMQTEFLGKVSGSLRMKNQSFLANHSIEKVFPSLMPEIFACLQIEVGFNKARKSSMFQVSGQRSSQKNRLPRTAFRAQGLVSAVKNPSLKLLFTAFSPSVSIYSVSPVQFNWRIQNGLFEPTRKTRMGGRVNSSLTTLCALQRWFHLCSSLSIPSSYSFLGESEENIFITIPQSIEKNYLFRQIQYLSKSFQNQSCFVGTIRALFRNSTNQDIIKIFKPKNIVQSLPSHFKGALDVGSRDTTQAGLWNQWTESYDTIYSGEIQIPFFFGTDFQNIRFPQLVDPLDPSVDTLDPKIQFLDPNPVLIDPKELLKLEQIRRFQERSSLTFLQRFLVGPSSLKPLFSTSSPLSKLQRDQHQKKINLLFQEAKYFYKMWMSFAKYSQNVSTKIKEFGGVKVLRQAIFPKKAPLGSVPFHIDPTMSSWLCNDWDKKPINDRMSFDYVQTHHLASRKKRPGKKKMAQVDKSIPELLKERKWQQHQELVGIPFSNLLSASSPQTNFSLSSEDQFRSTLLFNRTNQFKIQLIEDQSQSVCFFKNTFVNIQFQEIIPKDLQRVWFVKTFQYTTKIDSLGKEHVWEDLKEAQDHSRMIHQDWLALLNNQTKHLVNERLLLIHKLRKYNKNPILKNQDLKTKNAPKDTSRLASKGTKGFQLDRMGRKYKKLLSFFPIGSLIRFRSFESPFNTSQQEGMDGDLVQAHIGRIIQKDSNQIVLRFVKAILLPAGAEFSTRHGSLIQKNDVLFSFSQQKSKTGDIVQGLPKINRLFEARRLHKTFLPNFWISPKAPTNNQISLHKKQTVLFPGENSFSEEQLKPFETYEAILDKPYSHALSTDGIDKAIEVSKWYSSPSDYNKEWYKFTYDQIRMGQLNLLEQIQSVYGSQGVSIDDKHIEIIIRQMTSKLVFLSLSDLGFLPGDTIDAILFKKVSSFCPDQICVIPILLGISKLALKQPSILAPASFQETKRVLVRSALSGRIDFLAGLKEHVMLGNIIPAGTGFEGLFSPPPPLEAMHVQDQKSVKGTYKAQKTSILGDSSLSPLSFKHQLYQRSLQCALPTRIRLFPNLLF